MELPTIDTIKQNIDAWKEHARKLKELIKSAKLTKKLDSQVPIIKGYFDKHVSCLASEKEFEPSKLIICGNDKYYYEHDGVIIKKNGRTTYHLGDYDLFFAYKIWLDGKLIYSADFV